VRTREFRVDEYGAPRYPELVLAVTSETLEKRGEVVDTMLQAIEKGTLDALSDRKRTVRKLVEASGADEPLMRAQLSAVAPALLPAVSLDRQVLDGWAAFDAQFGILRERPDVEEMFPLR